MDIIYHIWESISIPKSGYHLERFQMLIKEGVYSVNEQTLQGLNTPLHFAVIYENVKTFTLLMKYNEIKTDIKNKEGMTPMDYAHLISNKQTRYQILNQFTKALSSKILNELLPS